MIAATVVFPYFDSGGRDMLFCQRQLILHLEEEVDEKEEK